ncbi:BQ5605_C005g03388 [Microbotryum silenes-dioicae]|uniref:BQ5605_C005g03388 protein n=1 Tax=Microbotryum silenes-dioicae TaxID=796604 RepID=A0A2X0PCE8_9BASI|nr:BQ5605_C005g03388 [Microbotryum silenes-dioicae]
MPSLEGLDVPDAILSTARYDPPLSSLDKNSLTQPSSAPSPYGLLAYHHDRLVQAAAAFAWTSAAQSLEGEQGLIKLRQRLDQAVSQWQTQNDDKSDQPLRVSLPTMMLEDEASYSVRWCTLPQLRILVFPTADDDDLITVQAFACNPITPISNFFNLALANPATLNALSSSSTFTYIPVRLDPARTSPSIWTQYKTTARDHYLASRERAGLGRDYNKPDEVLLFNQDDQVMEGSLANVGFYRDGAWVTPHDEAGGLNGVMRRWLLEQGRWKQGTILRGEVSRGEWVLLSNGLRGCFVGRIES